MKILFPKAAIQELPVLSRTTENVPTHAYISHQRLRPVEHSRRTVFERTKFNQISQAVNLNNSRPLVLDCLVPGNQQFSACLLYTGVLFPNLFHKVSIFGAPRSPAKQDILESVTYSLTRIKPASLSLRQLSFDPRLFLPSI